MQAHKKERKSKSAAAPVRTPPQPTIRKGEQDKEGSCTDLKQHDVEAAAVPDIFVRKYSRTSTGDRSSPGPNFTTAKGPDGNKKGFRIARGGYIPGPEEEAEAQPEVVDNTPLPPIQPLLLQHGSTRGNFSSSASADTSPAPHQVSSNKGSVVTTPSPGLNQQSLAPQPPQQQYSGHSQQPQQQQQPQYGFQSQHQHYQLQEQQNLRRQGSGGMNISTAPLLGAVDALCQHDVLQRGQHFAERGSNGGGGGRKSKRAAAVGGGRGIPAPRGYMTEGQYQQGSQQYNGQVQLLTHGGHGHSPSPTPTGSGTSGASSPQPMVHSVSSEQIAVPPAPSVQLFKAAQPHVFNPSAAVFMPSSTSASLPSAGFNQQMFSDKNAGMYPGHSYPPSTSHYGGGMTTGMYPTAPMASSMPPHAFDQKHVASHLPQQHYTGNSAHARPVPMPTNGMGQYGFVGAGGQFGGSAGGYLYYNDSTGGRLHFGTSAQAPAYIQQQ